MKPTGLWLRLTALSAFLLLVVFFQGAFSAGKDLDDTCAAAGHELDQEYLVQHLHEPLQLFPLHNKCNALYDTVPEWINPALVILAALTTLFFVAMLTALFISVKSRL
jgi:hypothetical protein